MGRLITILLLVFYSEWCYSQQKELFTSIVARNYEQVTSQLSRGTAINSVYQDETALSIATLSGDRKMAAFLISKGASISAHNSRAIQYAVQYGMADLIGLYISKMPAVNWKELLPYHAVVMEFPLQTVNWVLYDYMPKEAQSSLPDPDKLPYLRLLNDSKRSIAAIDTLIKYKVPIDLVDEDGLTALDFCFSMDHPGLNIMLHLIERKFPARSNIGAGELAYAGILAKNDSLVISMVKNHPEVINNVIKGNPLLHTALLSGNDRLADTLLALGANPALLGLKGRNAAHVSAIGNCHIFFDKHHQELLPLVVKKDSTGLNGLETSVVFGNDKFKEMMLSRYIDTAGVSSKIFPLIAALGQENEKIVFTEGTFRFVAQMIQRNNFRYSKDRDDLEPLVQYVKGPVPSAAAMQYFISLVAHLRDTTLTALTFEKWYPNLNTLQRTVLLRSAIDRKSTLFFLAKQDDAIRLWPVVAEWNADLNQPGEYMERLTITAAHAKNWDFLRLLIHHGARVNEPGANYSLLFACAAQGQLEIVQYLLTKDARLTPNEIDILLEQSSYLGERPLALQYVLTMELLRKQMLSINPADDLPLHQPVTKKRQDLVKYESFGSLKPGNVQMKLRQLPAKFVMGFPDQMKPGNEISMGLFGQMSFDLKEIDVPSAYNENSTFKYFSLAAYIPDFGYRPFIDFGSLSPADLQKAKLRTDIKLAFELPYIPFDSLYPVSFPIATIRNDNYNSGKPLIKITHLRDTGIVISAGNEDTYDLSAGKVEALMPFIADKSVLTNITITMHEGFAVEKPSSNQFIDRLRYYQQADAVSKRLSKSAINAGTDKKYVFETKKLQTVLHLMSEYAVQSNFLYQIQQELKQELVNISSYNTQLKNVYSVMNGLLINPGDKKKLLETLDKLATDISNAELKEKLKDLHAKVKASENSMATIELVAGFLEEGVFGPVNYSVVRVQTLLFELSQFLTKQHLQEVFDNQLKIPANSSVWNENNVVFKGADVDGKGEIIIKNLITRKK